MKKIITVRTENENLIKWLASKTNQSNTIESILIQLINGELVLKSEHEAKQKIQLAKLRKQNLKLDLENWQTLKSMNFKQEQIIQLLNGEITIKQLSYPKTENKETEKFAGLDANGYCGTCFHNHFNSNGICCRDNCNCGIRG